MRGRSTLNLNVPPEVRNVDKPAFPLSFGVVQAEEIAREAQIIAERHAQNARILAEHDRIAYKPAAPNPATCDHDEISVFQDVTQEDHETIFGACHACGAWVVSTLFLSSDRPIETRVMTAGELDQFRGLEDRRARSEWLWE